MVLGDAVLLRLLQYPSLTVAMSKETAVLRRRVAGRVDVRTCAAFLWLPAGYNEAVRSAGAGIGRAFQWVGGTGNGKAGDLSKPVSPRARM
jgi:hypothetical protein